MRAVQAERGEWALGEAPRTAEGKAPPWMLPNPSDMGTRCSRNRMTINRKNLLPQRCQACRRVSAGGAPLGGESRNAPLVPWLKALLFSQVMEGREREVPPTVGKVCTRNSARSSKPGLQA